MHRLHFRCFSTSTVCLCATNATLLLLIIFLSNPNEVTVGRIPEVTVEQIPEVIVKQIRKRLITTERRPWQVKFDPSSVIRDDQNLEHRHAVMQIIGAMNQYEPFEYLVEPTVCTGKRNATVVFYVSSRATVNASLRNAIRETWAVEAKAMNFEVVFAMGRDVGCYLSNSTNDVEALTAENNRFGDIFMVNYRDGLDHLMLRWWSDNRYHSTRCSHVPFAMAVDSDTFVLAKNFAHFLSERGHEFTTNVIACHVIFNATVVRNPKSRFYVDPIQWPYPNHLAYCSGSAILVSVESARKLAEAVPKLGIHFVTSSRRTVDILTGPIAKIAGVKVREVSGFYSWLLTVGKNVCESSTLTIHPAKTEERIRQLYSYLNSCCVNANSECPAEMTLSPLMWPASTTICAPSVSTVTAAPSASTVTFASSTSMVTVAPSASMVTASPSASMVTASPSALMVTASPSASMVTVAPSASMVTVAPSASVVTASPSASTLSAVPQLSMVTATSVGFDGEQRSVGV